MLVLQSIVFDPETVTFTYASPGEDVRLVNGRPAVMTRQLTLPRDVPVFGEEMDELFTQVGDLLDDVLTTFAVSKNLEDAQGDDDDEDDDDDEGMGS